MIGHIMKFTIFAPTENNVNENESKNDFGGWVALLICMANGRSTNRISETGISRSMDTMCKRTISRNASPADAGYAYWPTG